MLTLFQQTLKAQIKRQGPLPLSEVMDLSNAYYYAHQKVFGAHGDFITSPEISQIFGEVVAFWLLNHTLPENILAPTIVELGPGRGILARDMMGIFSNVTNFTPRFYFLEQSEPLRRVQQETLAPYAFEKQWIQCLSTLPKGPTFFIANEFFDALPIQQTIDALEIHVDFKDAFVFSPEHFESQEIIESSPTRLAFAQYIAAHLKDNKGAGLIIDYGDYTEERRNGDTLQAILNHSYVHPLDHLGEADLTAHVDFKALSDVFLSFKLAVNFMTQAAFLNAYGFKERLSKRLTRSKTPQERNDQNARAQRLTDAHQMGHLFKVLEVLTPKEFEK